MSTTGIRLGAAANVRDFQNLLNALATHESDVLDSDALQDEFGRLRVWSGNLGALQKGHSSLDYRLRDAPLLSNEVLKLLKELEDNLHAAYEIVTGVRLPYEQQSKPNASGEDDEDEDDNFFSEDEDDESDPAIPNTELNMRFREIVDILDNLYKISVRIRAPTVRTRSLKAVSYQPKDPETGVDLLDQYAIFDIQHTQELVRHLRKPHVHDAEPSDGADGLVNRLARAVTLRRRQFKYWRRHRDKLGISTVLEEPQAPPALHRPEALHRHDTLEAQPSTPGLDVVPKATPSQKTGKTLLSGTEATHHHQSLDEIVDAKSVTSYAVTVKDLTGKGIDLPPPPKRADGERDFECPYCFIICPARYGKGRSWRTHVLQDMQPYVCTYLDCQTPDQLFRSRRDWMEHESSHRKAWRCPEHLEAVYKSQVGLEEHLKSKHGDSIPEGQLSSIVKVGETSTVDMRPKCPICYASTNVEGVGNLQNHIANHLERIAAFSLPIDVDDDADGGSSQASRGRTESTDLPTASSSSDISDYSDNIIDQEGDDESLLDSSIMASSGTVAPPVPVTTGQQGILSESLIRDIPDDSGKRLDLLFSNQEVDSDESGEEDSKEAEANVEEHMAEREAFRQYLLSLPGAQSVRFFRRYGSWNGNVNFKDADFAAMALQHFDKSRYPRARLRQKDAKRETLKFSVLQHQQVKEVSFRKEVAVAQAASSESVSSGSLSQHEGGHEDDELAPVRAASDIPTLRALYRSSELLPRNTQDYAPNDGYNQIISFCYYDITRLEVDAIVNSANRELTPSRAEWTLNSLIHRAAGPGLQEECSGLGKLRTAQSALTGGHMLPCTHIIHVSRPNYSNNKGMGKFNLLTECYRSSLRLAVNHRLKTVAFCSLCTGGIGFPARIAARIALQEVREFLDAHPDHPFKRIIFCVYADDDEAAYKEHLPLFFPPTSEDLELAGSIKTSGYGAKLSTLAQDIYKDADKATQQLQTLCSGATNLPQQATRELSSVATLLESFKELVLRPGKEFERLLSRMIHHIDLLCSVMLALCGHLTEMVELAKGKENLGQPSHETIWDDYNTHMQAYQGLTIVQLIDLCQEFAQHLNTVLEKNAEIPHEMKTIGIRLGAWIAKQTGKGTRNIEEHFEEIMLTREYQRDATVTERVDTVKLFKIPTLAKLYQTGALQPKATDISPSPHHNYKLCFIREDITKLEVDILVNSTDTQFSSSGRLSHTVFQRGGPDMQKECVNYPPLSVGEVILTKGYALPVKHVLHAIPPEIYRQDTKHILRNMYKKILTMAGYLKATSIAIPALGTGGLNYPRRESAAIAIEEVKQFVESLEDFHPIEKIVFVVYSSNDEFVYKSLLPVYFPPLDLNTEDSLPEIAPVTSEATSPPPRTLFGSLGDAFRKMTSGNLSVSPGRRSVSSGKRPVYSGKRPMLPGEEDVLIIFENHAQTCPTCSQIPKVYEDGGDLCGDGYALAAQVLQFLHMKTDQLVYSIRLEGGDSPMEIPDIFPHSLELLRAVEKSFRDPNRERPFVSNQPSLGLKRHKVNLSPDYTVYNVQVSVYTRDDQERKFLRIHVWSHPSQGWQNFQSPEPSLHLTRGALLMREGDGDTVSSLPVRLSLTPRSIISKQSATEILVRNVDGEEAAGNDPGSCFRLVCRSQIDCEMLLVRLRHSAKKAHTGERDRSLVGGVESDINTSSSATTHQTSEVPTIKTVEPSIFTKTYTDEDIFNPDLFKKRSVGSPKAEESILGDLYANFNWKEPVSGTELEDQSESKSSSRVDITGRQPEGKRSSNPFVERLSSSVNTWTAPKMQLTLPRVARHESYREPKSSIEEHEPDVSVSEPNLSPTLPMNDDVDDLLSGMSTIDIAGPSGSRKDPAQAANDPLEEPEATE